MKKGKKRVELPELEVTITGVRGAGKTVLADVIMAALQNRGYTVERYDEWNGSPGQRVGCGDEMSRAYDQRLVRVFEAQGGTTIAQDMRKRSDGKARVGRKKEELPERCCGRCSEYDAEQRHCKRYPEFGYLTAARDVCDRFQVIGNR